MGLKRLKVYSEKLLEPASSYLSARGIAPDHLTVAGLVTSAISGLFYYHGEHPIAGLAMAVSGLCDLMDGNLARTQNKVTPFGAFFDSTVDRYSDMFALFGILGYSFNRGDAVLFLGNTFLRLWAPLWSVIHVLGPNVLLRDVMWV